MDSDLVALLRNPETPDYVIRDFILENGGGAVANVYVVVGSTGEYSDYHTWTVAAFLDESHANAVWNRLTAWVKEHGYHDSGYNWPRDERPAPPDDPQFYADYTGTKYTVEAIPLRVEG